MSAGLVRAFLLLPLLVSSASWASPSPTPTPTGVAPTLLAYSNYALYGTSPLTLYQADDTTTVDTGKSFYTVSTSLTTPTAVSGDMTGLIRFRVRADASRSNQVVSILAQTSNGWKYVPIAASQGSRCNSLTCQGLTVPSYTGDTAAYYFSARFAADTTTVEVGVFAKDICEAVRLQGDTSLVAEGCTNGDVTPPVARTSTSTNDAVAAVFNLRVYVTVAPDAATVGPTDSAQDAQFTRLNVSVEKGGPIASAAPCPTLSSLYFPGDGEIYVESGTFDSAYLEAGAPATHLVVVGANGAAPTQASIDSNSVVGRLPLGYTQPVSGFTNTTNGSDNLYTLYFLIRDAAGALYSVDSTSCNLQNVQTASINQFLNRSRCFIATAAYRSPDAPAVSMLRNFRDQILDASWLGRAFVQSYYRWSPPAAEWLYLHPAFRGPVLLLLLPVEIVAWLLLHPSVAVLLVALFGAVVALETRRRAGRTGRGVSR